MSDLLFTVCAMSVTITLTIITLVSIKCKMKISPLAHSHNTAVLLEPVSHVGTDLKERQFCSSD